MFGSNFPSLFTRTHQHAAALEAAEALLTEVPENRDVLYTIGVSQRYLGRIPEALDTLARFEKIHPRYSRLLQDRGHCQVVLRTADPAIEEYLHAVNQNPALWASWKALFIVVDGRTNGKCGNGRESRGHSVLRDCAASSYT